MLFTTCFYCFFLFIRIMCVLILFFTIWNPFLHAIFSPFPNKWRKNDKNIINCLQFCYRFLVFFLHISSPLPFMLRGIIQYSFLFWQFHKLEVCLNVHMFGKYQVESKTLKRSGEKNQFKWIFDKARNSKQQWKRSMPKN